MATTGLCTTCIYSCWCPTWGDYRCFEKEIRLSTYGFQQPINCSVYKKRGKDFKEPKCQCENCLENEKSLDDEEEEENE